MRRNVLLAAGPPSHDFAALGGFVAGLLAADDIATDLVVDLDELADRLRDPEPPALVTVLALQFTMQHPRYDEIRASWAVHTDPGPREALAGFVDGGGGLLALHTACVCFDDWPGWGELLGAAWDWERSSHDPVGPARLEPTAVDHPITRGLGPFEVDDEVYEALGTRGPLEPLVIAERGGAWQPIVWTRRHGAGRVVVDTLGHATASLGEPTHAALLRRSARWVLHDPDAVVAGIAPTPAEPEPMV